MRATKITVSRKQRISALTNTVRGRVERGGRGGGGGGGRFQRGKGVMKEEEVVEEEEEAVGIKESDLMTTDNLL